MMDMSGGGSHGAPVENPDETAVNGKFPGAVVFPMSGDWMLHAQVHNHLTDKEGEAMIPLTIHPAARSGVHALTTLDNKELLVAWARRNVVPVSGMNDIEFTVHHAVDLMTWEADSSYSIVITPEMPDMGHGSDGNVNPVHILNGHYKGQVNFTMAGDWRVHVQLKKNGADAALPFYFDVKVN
jgi:hypothetical protein